MLPDTSLLPDVLGSSSFVVVVVYVIINAVRRTNRVPSAYLPLLAIGIGVFLMPLWRLAVEPVFTVSVAILALFNGAIAGYAASYLVEDYKKARARSRGQNDVA